MLQPKKDNFKLNQSDQSLLEKEMINYANEGASDDDLIEFKNTFISEKKKGVSKSNDTSTPPKSGSATPIGSSGGKGFPKMKTFDGFSDAELKKMNSANKPVPVINKNIKNKIKEQSLRDELKNVKVTPSNMESVSLKTDALSEVTKQNKKADLEYESKSKEDYSFLDYSLDSAESGISTFYKSIVDAPEYLYDTATQLIANPILKTKLSPFLFKSGNEIADDLGLRNIPADILKERIVETNQIIELYNSKNGVDPLKAIEEGNITGAAKMVAGSTIQSAPLMVAALLSGGSSLGLGVVGVSAASTQNSELKDKYPEMDTNTRLKNAMASGVIEATVGSLFTGASGAVMKRIVADKGVEVGSKIVTKSFKRTLEKAITKNPIVGAVGETFEEGIVEGLNQTKDIITGIRTDYDLRAIGNASISATGMGGVQTVGVYGAKAYIGAKNYKQIKNVNKEIGRLSLDIENENTTPENKVLIAEKINKLVADNRKLLGTELEKLKTLPAETKKELNGIATLLSDIQSKAEDIREDDSISPENKQIALNELNDQLKVAGKRKIEILSSVKDVVVDNDFSKFEGVDPDFDLGNGKIATLPLKEQDRLNDQALQELTGGDMTIEVTKEQVSQKANEIYENEQNSTTPEAQPQAEVQKPSEEEKVEQKPLTDKDGFLLPVGEERYVASQETTVAEEVVVPSVEQAEGVSTVVDNGIVDEKGNPKTFYHGSENEFEGDFKNINPNIDGFWFSDSKENARTYGKNLKTVTLDIRNPLVIDAKGKKFTDDIEVEVLASYPNQKPYLTKISLGADEIVYMVKNGKRKNSFIEIVDRDKYDGVVIKNFVDPSLSSRSEELQTSVVAFNNKQIKQNEAASQNNTPTDGNVRPTVNNVGEEGITKSETPNAESVPSSVDGGEAKGDSEVSDVDNAIAEIDKGVLIWNGDMGAERVNLGITWVDIRKGEKDIKAGRVNTAPAKKLITALKTAKERGGYEYVQGSGGQVRKQFVSLEDIQRANNEYDLTVSEQKEVDAQEAELAKEYNENFNSLSEQEQIEILENYENREDNSGTPSADSQQLQSKNDVPTEKEGTGENSGAKEKTALEKAQEARRAAKAKLVAKRQNLSIASDPEQDAQDLYDYHQALVTEAKEHIKIGVKSLADFAKAIGEKVSISIKTAWQEANGEISPISKGEDLNYNLDTADDEVKAESKESTEDLESFRDSWNLEPSSGEFNQYDSGKTIEREQGTPRNNQTYEVQKDLARVQIGIRAMQHAKKLFGAEYVEKTLSFIEQANLSPEKKAVAYVLLENEMDARVKASPKSVGEQKLQDLVRAKSQAFLANSARAIGAGRFRVERYRELAKKGFSEDDFTNIVLTKNQIDDKEKIQQIIQVTPDDVNAEADAQETKIVDEDIEKLIAEGVEKQINNIYKKLPTNRRIKADKAIKALENIQKSLRSKTYDASIGIPVALIDSGITVIKNSIKAGVNIADAIELGINHIKSKYGKDWEKENDFRNDMLDGFKGEGVSVVEKTTKEKSNDQKAKEAVKQALIDKGFFREVKVKGEVKKYLDWKKLAGEEGSVEKIRKNVEEALAESGYTKKQIEEMSDALEKEYVRLSADVIEKGLKELKNRDTPRKPSELKSAARKLAELNNYGLFEDNQNSYENIINSLLGINDLDQKALDGMKEIANGYTTLMNSGFSEIAMKGAINELSRRQSRLLGNYSFVNGSKRFKIMTALQEITNLSTRFKLVNLGNLAENVSSGIMARAYNDITDMFVAKSKGEKRTTNELRSQTSKNARAKLKGIVFEASESYGDTSSMLLDHSMIEDRINESTSNKYVHALLSSYMGRPVLEGADSFNKILLTEAKIRNAASRVLMKKGMSKKESLNYISKALTGESMADAKVKAKKLIDEVNNKAGKKILNDSDVAVDSLASDIVKDALVSGGQMTEKELEAVYNSAYKSAGRDIGHVSNNSFTDMISANNAKIEKKVADAIKEKNWQNAAYFTAQKIIYRNFVYTFVGGGTNWFVKGLQKAGNPLSYISLYDDIRLRAGKELDITSDEGIKNMEKVLYRDMNLRSTAGTIMIGSLNALMMFTALKVSGGDDELNEWLKENEWAKKFFDKMAPDVVVAMLAWENKEMGRYYSKMINQKPDFFDDTKNIQKVLDNYTKGYVNDDKTKIDKASGILGGIIGSRFDVPGPLRLAKDIKKVYKGAVENETEETDYYTSGFWNGFLRGGIVESWGLRPEPASPEEEKSKKSTPGVPSMGGMGGGGNPKM